MGFSVLILGAHSDIGRALAHRYAKDGWHILLAGRRPKRLTADVQDLKIRYGVEAQGFLFDAEAYDTHADFFRDLPAVPEVVISVFGYLGDQEQAQTDWQEASRILRVNYVGAVSILNIAAQHLENQGKGTLVGISSVAGERGRSSNYHYGSAKAGFTSYLSGLRNRLTGTGVEVLTVKPGYVYTAMTEGMTLPKLLTATPEEVAEAIFKAVKRKKHTLYVRWMWRYIMWIIRNIPEPLFRKMSL